MVSLSMVKIKSQYAAIQLVFYKRFNLVPRAGIEPARHFCRGILSPLCLPISPPGLSFYEVCSDANGIITGHYGLNRRKSHSTNLICCLIDGRCREYSIGGGRSSQYLQTDQNFCRSNVCLITQSTQLSSLCLLKLVR